MERKLPQARRGTRPAFSFLRSLTSEVHAPLRSHHFQRVINDIDRLEQWMKRENVKNDWTLIEKLAFLRNVESTIRTDTAIRRTQLSWFTLMAGSTAALVGILIGLTHIK